MLPVRISLPRRHFAFSGSFTEKVIARTVGRHTYGMKTGVNALTAPVTHAAKIARARFAWYDKKYRYGRRRRSVNIQTVSVEIFDVKAGRIIASEKFRSAPPGSVTEGTSRTSSDGVSAKTVKSWVSRTIGG